MFIVNAINRKIKKNEKQTDNNSFVV